ncbi:glycosyltransferase family 1 protein [Pseudorhizobium endolithicum]|uniref:Glycosyltransferase family 1 protein n=1 Tax=Pseudorhizobium endolithicum TaxID=1191678 RepID=A0ABN7JTM4_9HYPH|nr:glycosyltransferase family 4 protein [Pseudorhizobium endolithicum]CAD7039243.1 glycosyltransferase family 1 protein [Pseudorhizobium endolithicum]
MNLHPGIYPSPRLLNINNYFYRRGGAEAVFLDHSSLFEEIGWNVVPFSMRHEKNLPSPWSDYFVSEIEYGQQSGALAKAIQASKVIYSLEARANLGRLLSRARPDIAHAHNVYHHLSPAIFSTLKDAGIPTVMTAHDLKIACPSYKMLRDGRICEECKGGKIHNVVLHRCIKGSLPLSAVVYAETSLHRLLGTYRTKVDRIVVPSRFYRNKLEEWGWEAERLVYIPNFVDLGLFQTDWEEGDYFVFAGRLAPEKGISTLIRAAAQAKQKVVIAGTGPEEASLRKLADEAGADITFAGFVAGEALHRLIGQSRALILPSEWYENAPISILEAYALARPVIGSEIGGIPEMIRAGETGLTSPAASVDTLADTLSQLADAGPARRREMGAAGREWVSRDFSRTSYRDRMLALYGELAPAITARMPALSK